MSSFTKPCNVLSMFLNFEPWKPYILISFVLIKKISVLAVNKPSIQPSLSNHLREQSTMLTLPVTLCLNAQHTQRS